jgi:flagellar basal-body rod modification protein FlgD
MSINSIGNNLGQPQPAAPPNSALNGLNADFDFFLKLLTTQLQNQDPTEPLDTNQLTDQITQFSQVEQQSKTNSLIEDLISEQKQTQLSSAVGFIGSEVETQGSSGQLIGSRGIFGYDLGAIASNVQITITNDSGRAVFQGNGTTALGRNLVVWDGVNSFNGELEPEGNYNISIAATTSNGAQVPSETRSVGLVGGVETDTQGNVLLNVANVLVPYEEILAVRAPGFGI